MDLGSPLQLSKPQAACIKSMSDGRPERLSIVNVATDGTVLQTFVPRENDVCFVTLTKL